MEDPLVLPDPRSSRCEIPASYLAVDPVPAYRLFEENENTSNILAPQAALLNLAKPLWEGFDLLTPPRTDYRLTAAFLLFQCHSPNT